MIEPQWQQKGQVPLVLPPKGAPCIMNGLLFGCDAMVATWVNDRLGAGPIVEAPFVAIGALADPEAEAPSSATQVIELAAGAYFTDHMTGRASDITITVAIADPSKVSRTAIRQLLQYPFGQLGVRRVTAYIPLDNAASLSVAERLGFKKEGVKRRGWDTTDLGVFGLLPDECPYWTAAQ